MSPRQWTIIVVRAWRDDGGVRARLLRRTEAETADAAVVSSPAKAAEVVGQWLREFISDDAESVDRDPG